MRTWGRRFVYFEAWVWGLTRLDERVTGTVVAPCQLLVGVDCVLPKPVEMGAIVGELRG